MAEAAAAPQLDLDAYCARIGYTGPRTATVETLRALHRLHPAAIPFEAVDVLLGRVIDIAPAAIEAKLIGAKRGGYCFEHNRLFARALEAMGFIVHRIAGRVRWGRAPEAPPMPRSHMALIVTIAGEDWLADVGFGGCVPTAPLRIGTSEVQQTDHEPFRVLAQGDALLVEARRHDVWLPLYELTREPQLDIDYEVANWFTSTHADSPFVQNLVAARVTPEARYALRDNRLTIRHSDGRSEQETVDAAGVEKALVDIFLLPVEPAWRPLIARMVARGAHGAR